MTAPSSGEGARPTPNRSGPTKSCHGGRTLAGRPVGLRAFVFPAPVSARKPTPGHPTDHARKSVLATWLRLALSGGVWTASAARVRWVGRLKLLYHNRLRCVYSERGLHHGPGLSSGCRRNGAHAVTCMLRRRRWGTRGRRERDYRAVDSRHERRTSSV